jgi:hypothetical protein
MDLCGLDVEGLAQHGESLLDLGDACGMVEVKQPVDLLPVKVRPAGEIGFANPELVHVLVQAHIQFDLQRQRHARLGRLALRGRRDRLAMRHARRNGFRKRTNRMGQCILPVFTIGHKFREVR